MLQNKIIVLDINPYCPVLKHFLVVVRKLEPFSLAPCLPYIWSWEIIRL